MIGTIANTIAILVGSITGSFLKKGIKPRYQNALYNAMGLAAVALGINAVATHMPKSQYPVLFIGSLALGSLLGTKLNLERRFQSLINRYSKSNLAQGLTTGLLLYCIGTLSIVGPVMSALYGDHTYLYTNATLDLVTSTVLAGTYGIGMALAAPVLFLWQGSIYLLTCLAGPVISDALVAEISIVGGILIFCSGISILKIKEIKTLDLLPSLLVPPLFFVLKKVVECFL